MEDYIEFKDYLCFAHDKQIRILINEEQLFFSDKLKILYTLGLPFERNIIITNNALYNLDNKSKLFYKILLFNI